MTKWRLDEPCELPEGAYYDNEGFMHAKDGSYLPDGEYTTHEGVVVRYEMFFKTGRFELLDSAE